MRRIGLAFVGHLAGILLTIFAWDEPFGGASVRDRQRFRRSSLQSFDCGPVSGQNHQTQSVPRLVPGGIVIGGLVDTSWATGLGWQAQFATMLLPLAAYAVLFVGPPCEDRTRRDGRFDGRYVCRLLASGVLAVGGLHC